MAKSKTLNRLPGSDYTHYDHDKAGNLLPGSARVRSHYDNQATHHPKVAVENGNGFECPCCGNETTDGDSSGDGLVSISCTVCKSFRGFRSIETE